MTPSPRAPGPDATGAHLTLRAARRDLDAVPITVIGHPFAPIGMGEQLRSHLAAMDAVFLAPRVMDIFRHAARLDDEMTRLVGEREVRVAAPGLRIFHLNADEIERAREELRGQGSRFEDGINVLVPAWELPRFPAPWVPAVRAFDEVWAISRHVRASLAGAGIESQVIGQSVEPARGALLPRRWFGIRESAFVLLSFLDLTSYEARKNPAAALELFARLGALRPAADLQFVLKVKRGDASAAGWARDWLARQAGAAAADPRRLLLTEPLDQAATRSLISAADCFVSLHRAEGFGRGLGEAMALGRLALGTDWSGNVDFMHPDCALQVPYRQVPVRAGEYPHARGQRWAEPDVHAAAEMLARFVDDRAQALATGARARLHVLASHGHRAVGLRILARLEALLGRTAAPRPA